MDLANASRHDGTPGISSGLTGTGFGFNAKIQKKKKEVVWCLMVYQPSTMKKRIPLPQQQTGLGI
jgi:hypothetical protein